MITNIEIIYRIQGWLEIRDESQPISHQSLATIVGWIKEISPNNIAGILYHTECLFEDYLIHKIDENELPQWLKVFSRRFDEIFEHYITEDYPGNPEMLLPVELAANKIKIKILPHLIAPEKLAYRLQGYFELSGKKELSELQVEIIKIWLKKLNHTNYYAKQICLFFHNEYIKENITDLRDILSNYFIDIIDPSYPGDQHLFNKIHAGELNDSKFT